MKKLRKLLAVMLAVCLVMTVLVTSATASGQTYYKYAVDGGEVELVSGLGYFYGVKYSSSGSVGYAGSYSPNGLILCSADSTITKAVIPSTYSGYASSSSGGVYEEGEGSYIEDEPITAIQGITGGESGAFYGCTLLTSVTIPSTVKYIYGGAFAGCTSLTEIIFEDNDYYCYVDGAIYTKDMTTLVCYIDGSRTSFVVPDTVTEIGDFAFVGAPSLTSITIPASVTTIGTGALTGNGLTTVTFEQGSPFVAEGNLILSSDKTTVLSYYGSVSGVTIPTSITEISDYAFCGVDISGRTSSATAGIRISSIYYQGTEAQWEAVTVGDGNMRSSTNVYYSCYSINVNDVENGTVTIWTSREDGVYNDNYSIDSTTYSVSEGEYFAKEGVTVTFTAYGDYGYTISDISAIDDEGNNVEVTSQGSYTYSFTMPESDITVSVVFEAEATEPTTYAVTVGEVENGTVTVDVSGAEAGDTVTLTVTPADGYEVSSVTVTDASGNTISVSGSNGIYTFTMPSSTVSITPTFTASSSSDSPATPTHTHTTETVIENYIAATATTDGSYDSVTYCTECGEIISESHTVIAAYGSGVGEVIDWATALTDSIVTIEEDTTAAEDVVIEEPIESTDTETEVDSGDEVTSEPETEEEPETNPTTGMVLALLPMAIALAGIGIGINKKK